jgi:hypothetical protein
MALSLDGLRIGCPPLSDPAVPNDALALEIIREMPSLAEYRHRGDRLILQWNARGAVRTLVVGKGSAAFVTKIRAQWDAAVRDGAQLESFLDFADMESYDSGFRSELTGWGLENRPRLKSIHTFSHSKIVNMGATVASLALGGMIQVHKDAESFEAAAARARLPARPAVR